jgi:Ion channel
MIREQIESIFRYLIQVWSDERLLTWLLAALIFDILIVYPLVSAFSSVIAIQIMNSLVISVVLLLCLFALTDRKITRMVFGGIVVIVISVNLVSFIFGVKWLRGWDILFSLATIIAFLSFILRYVYKEGTVTWHRIRAAVAAYLLIAMAFAFGYHLISFLIPGAINFPSKAQNIDDPRFLHIFNYFSVTTLTTLGYGDIIPVHPIARTLAMMEALVGQLYPTVTLARLVSLYILHGQKSDK